MGVVQGFLVVTFLPSMRWQLNHNIGIILFLTWLRNGIDALAQYTGWPQSHAPMLIKKVIVVTFIQIQSSLQGL